MSRCLPNFKSGLISFFFRSSNSFYSRQVCMYSIWVRTSAMLLKTLLVCHSAIARRVSHRSPTEQRNIAGECSNILTVHHRLGCHFFWWIKKAAKIWYSNFMNWSEFIFQFFSRTKNKLLLFVRQGILVTHSWWGHGFTCTQKERQSRRLNKIEAHKSTMHIKKSLRGKVRGTDINILTSS